ncbi:MAG: glycosyltransferase family 2 protein [Akkermansia sp.]|nr:glycosyltransferase family 2 protein [Akkermansia sp.]
MNQTEEKPLVVIRSLVYNHEPYLRDCLEGFVMQQTTFPFVAVVHDDCSTDGSAAIIREYAERFPHIIKPVYETENQYSKQDGSLRRAMDEACAKYGAKYIALCEGDDYWTDPHKLQKQVDFLESHPDFTLAFCNGVIQTPTKRIATHEDYMEFGWPHLEEAGEVPVEKMIEDRSWMVLTAGMVIRSTVYAALQKIRKKCTEVRSGDALIQAVCAVMGRSYYLCDSMIVYRYQTPGSWSSKNNPRKDQPPQRKAPTSRIKAEAALLHAYDIINEFSQQRHEGAIYRAQFCHARFLIARYSDSREQFIKALGQYLHYKRVKKYMPLPQGKFDKCLFLLQRFFHYPYHPNGVPVELVPAVLKHFYKEDGYKVSLRIGPLNLISFIKNRKRHKLYVVGKEIM